MLRSWLQIWANELYDVLTELAGQLAKMKIFANLLTLPLPPPRAPSEVYA